MSAPESAYVILISEEGVISMREVASIKEMERLEAHPRAWRMEEFNSVQEALEFLEILLTSDMQYFETL